MDRSRSVQDVAGTTPPPSPERAICETGERRGPYRYCCAFQASYPGILATLPDGASRAVSAGEPSREERWAAIGHAPLSNCLEMPLQCRSNLPELLHLVLLERVLLAIGLD